MVLQRFGGNVLIGGRSVVATLQKRSPQFCRLRTATSFSRISLPRPGSRGNLTLMLLMPPSVSGTRSSFISSPPCGTLQFNVDLEFIQPIALRKRRKLADDCGLTVALSRDEIFPDEVGTRAGSHPIDLAERRIGDCQVVHLALRAPKPPVPPCAAPWSVLPLGHSQYLIV
jgi:hypothetical protein